MNTGLSAVGFASSSIFNLSRAETTLGGALSKLTSGRRINRAADDAAGLAIASDTAVRVIQMRQASRNASDTLSALTVADGALAQASEVSTRIQELATMAATGTYTDEQRAALQTEYVALSEELVRIGQTASYNGVNLLDGSTLSAQIGSSGETVQVGGINLQTLSSTITSQDISTQAEAEAAVTSVEQFLQELTSQRSSIVGSAIARLESMNTTTSSQTIAQSSALSQIQDADLSSAVIDLTKARLLLRYQVTLIQQSSLPTRLSVLG